MMPEWPIERFDGLVLLTLCIGVSWIVGAIGLTGIELWRRYAKG